MKNLTLKQATEETKKVASKMPSDHWNVHNRFTELVEEVGELANAIQTTEGFKSKKRQKSHINDSICDILFELLLIADHYNVDLDKEYPAVLEHIDKRREKGEFDL